MSTENGNSVPKWEAIERFGYMLAKRYYRAFADKCAAAGITADDLKQSAYIVYTDAVRGFDPTAGYRFTTYYGRALYRAFLRQSFNKNRTLDRCISLSTPLTDEDDSDTLEDVTPDPSGEDVFIAIAERDYTDKLHADLERLLCMLTVEEAAFIRAYWMCGAATLREAAIIAGIEPERAAAVNRKAMTKLRKLSMCDRVFRQYGNDIISRHAYGGSDPTAYTAMKLVEAEADGFYYGC